MYRIDRPTFNKLGYDLDAAIVAYKQDLEAHRFTENVPAPITYPLVENIVKRHAGLYEVVEGKECVRIVDDVIMDKRTFYTEPTAEWTPVTSPDMVVGSIWSPEEQRYVRRHIPASSNQERNMLVDNRLAAIENSLSLLEPMVRTLTSMVESMQAQLEGRR